jgi:hypothetical protein
MFFWGTYVLPFITRLYMSRLHSLCSISDFFREKQYLHIFHTLLFTPVNNLCLITLSFPCFFQGAGTSAHLMLKFWPWLQLIGWEIDPMVTTLLISHFCSV